MKPRFPLWGRILALALTNVLLLAMVFAVFARVQYRFELSSFLLAPARDRMGYVSWRFALELLQTPRGSWDQLVARYSATYPAHFFLFRNDGTQLAGAPVTLPAPLLASLMHDGGPPPGGPGRGGHPPRPGPPDGHGPPVLVAAGQPRMYWVAMHIPIWSGTSGPPSHGSLIWMFPALWTNPFFFDYRPWLVVILAVVVVSTICWLPLIRGLTRAITQLTGAAGRIADGNFDVPIQVRRRDELGQLGQAIRGMAHRLSGYVHGQKRFLSDVAHELCSPIARIQVLLGILDQRVTPSQGEYLEDLHEEVEHMSALVNELLSFSRAEINAGSAPMSRVNVAETVARVLEREAPDQVRIENRVGGRVEVMAHPEYLFRSLANLVRNAVRYAGEAGPIVIAANRGGNSVAITVADQGPGLPEQELEEVFKPFYRPEFARQRETGGTGLGLAIVKSCVEACGGTVMCRNRTPHGLEVEIRLAAAH